MYNKVPPKASKLVWDSRCVKNHRAKTNVEQVHTTLSSASDTLDITKIYLQIYKLSTSEINLSLVIPF